MGPKRYLQQHWRVCKHGGHFFLMISTTKVFYPPGTQYTRGGGGGGGISPGNICPWGLNILGKSVQGTSIPRIFCLGGQN